MGVNKVDLANGETLIDLTSDTVTPHTLAKGVTAHNSKGEQIIGNLNPEGGGSGGIIDVTELPTSNIDENAVYRVTSKEASTLYVITNKGAIPAKDYLFENGYTEYYEFWVDELPADMTQTNSTSAYVYILNQTGVGYLNFMHYGVNSVGVLLVGNSAFDKGFASSIEEITEPGVYAVEGKIKVHWFVRENGEWKQISPNEQTKSIDITTPANLTILPDEGKTLSEVKVKIAFPTIADLIDNQLTHITEEVFFNAEGDAVNQINAYSFAHRSRIETVTIPDGVNTVVNSAFYGLTYLHTVTFKGKLTSIYSAAFVNCYDLTTINVPWSEGEVRGAPWGATEATINYNYTEG